MAKQKGKELEKQAGPPKNIGDAMRKQVPKDEKITIPAEIVSRAWLASKHLFNYPTVKDAKVEILPEGGGACFDFQSRETLIDPLFVTNLAKEAGLDVEKALLGIGVHEIGHYMDFPRSLGNLILLFKMLNDFKKQEESDDFANFAQQTFSDNANDLCSVLKPGRREAILGVRESSQKLESDEFNGRVRGLMLAYLHMQGRNEKGKLEDIIPEMEKSGEIDGFTAGYLKEMAKIDFVGAKDDCTKMRIGALIWMNIVRGIAKDIFGENYAKAMKNSIEEGKGGACGMPSDISTDMIRNAGKGEIGDALREIAKKVSKGEHGKIRKLVREIRGEPAEPADYRPKSISVGSESGTLEIDWDVVDYYRELAKNYPIVVRKKPMKTKEFKKSFSETEKFRVGADPNLIMLETSGGVIMPGLTRNVKITGKPRTTLKYDTPHVLIVIDSSASMPRPKSEKSPMVTAAFCAALSYYQLGSKIGVINFSGDSFYLPYTRDLDSALASISAFQGGGTSVDVELLEKMLGPETIKLLAGDRERSLDWIIKDPMYHEAVRRATKKNVSMSIETVEKMLDESSIDLVMYTDLGIGNIVQVVNLFEDRAQLNRATIISTEKAREPIPHGTKITIFDEVKSIDDIIGITVGEIQKAVNNFASIG